jgi:hypothetical protein
MPRKSAAALRITRIPGKGRPETPQGLDPTSAKEWRDVVDFVARGFFDGAAQVLLRRVVAQVRMARRFEDRLLALAADHEDHIEAELALTAAHGRVTTNIIRGLTSLRVTPRSRAPPRDVGRTFARSPSGRRPWELRAPLIEGSAADDDGDDEIA